MIKLETQMFMNDHSRPNTLVSLLVLVQDSKEPKTFLSISYLYLDKQSLFEVLTWTSFHEVQA